MTDRVSMLIKGRFLERFMEEALREGVVFERIERLGVREARLVAGTADSKRVRALSERYGLELSVESRAGWRVAAEALLARNTLFFGLLLMMTLVVLFTSRVWVIELVAADVPLPAEAEADMSLALDDMGVARAMSRKSVDAGFISAQMLGEFPELTYVGVRLHGVYLTVEYKTEDAAPPVYHPEDTRNLVAARDAVVLSVTPLTGKACVRPGDTVRAGQTLIIGEERTGVEETHSIRAMGEVIARVWFSASSSASLEETVRTRTGRVARRSALRLYDWAWTLSEAEGFSCQDEEVELLPVGGLYLPVVIERVTMFEVNETVRPQDRAALEARLADRELSKARERLPEGAQESACWTKTSEADGQLCVEAVIETQMDIAVDG